MATLEEKLIEQLRPQIEQMGALTRRDIGRSALSAPAAVSAARRGGPQAAIAAARQFHPRAETGPGEMEIIGAKQSILKDMSRLAQVNNDATVGALGKITAMKSVDDKMMDVLKQYVASNADASARVAAARIGSVTDMAQKYADVVRDQVGASLSTGSGQARSAYNSARELMFGPDQAGQAPGPDAIAAIAYDVLHNASLGPADKAAVWTMLEGEAAGRGQDLRQMLAAAAQGAGPGSGSTDASVALSELERIQDQVNSLSERAMNEVRAAQFGARETILAEGGGIGMDRVIAAYKKMQAVYDPGAGPAHMKDMLDEALTALRPAEGQPDLMENYQKLLDQLDDENIPPASSLGQARARLIADPAFQQMMKAKGFKTPRAAIQWLRREIRGKRRQDRMHDAKLTRDIAAGIERPSAGAASGDIGAEGEVGSAATPPTPQLPEKFQSKQFAIDPEKGSVVMWDPATRQWTDEGPEVEQRVAAIEAADDAAYQKIVGQLVSDWPSLSSESLRAQATATPVPQVPSLQDKPPAQEETKKPFLLPSREMLAAGASNVLFGGSDAARSLTGAINKGLSKLSKKRKKKDEETGAAL